MGLFRKDYCSICGKDLGIFIDNKLADGYLCNECRSKLSPWFNFSRQLRLGEVSEQLAFREENKELVEAFNVTAAVGEDTTIYIDEDKLQLCVTSSTNIRQANPDILDFGQISGFTTDISEHRTEAKKKGDDGKMVSYDPPRYDYEYDVHFIIFVNHPYFNQMKFKVNQSDIEIKYVPEEEQVAKVYHFDDRRTPASRYVAPGRNMMHNNRAMPQTYKVIKEAKEFVPDPTQNREYIRAIEKCDEYAEALEQIMEMARMAQPVQEEVTAPVGETVTAVVQEKPVVSPEEAKQAAAEAEQLVTETETLEAGSIELKL